MIFKNLFLNLDIKCLNFSLFLNKTKQHYGNYPLSEKKMQYGKRVTPPQSNQHSIIQKTKEFLIKQSELRKCLDQVIAFRP